MKKVTEIIRPMLLIIFGALLLLFYMNLLSNQGAYLALGIIAVIFAAYYLTIGILDVVIGNKFNKTLRMAFDILNVSLFAVLMFVQFLITVIDMADFMGPTAWVIKILSMIAALAFAGFYIVARCIRKPIGDRLACLFAAIFSLALLLDNSFTDTGAPEAIGNVAMVQLAIYIIYVVFMIPALPKPNEAREDDDEPEQLEHQED